MKVEFAIKYGCSLQHLLLLSTCLGSCEKVRRVMSCVGIMIFYRAPLDDDKMNDLIHFKIVSLSPY